MRIPAIFDNKQGFYRNVSVLALCNMVVIVVNLCTHMYLARTLHPEGYGKYGIVIASSNILMTISSLGIQQVAIRRISQNQHKSWQEFKISFTARFLGYLLFSIPYIIYSAFLPLNQQYLNLIVVVNALALTVWSGIQNVAFGMQRMEYTGYLNVVATIIIFSVYLLIPYKIISVYLVLLVLILVETLKDIVYFFKCKQEKLFTYDENRNIGFKDIALIIRESFPFYVLAVLTLFSTDWPVVFLSNHSGAIEVAYYDSANKILRPTAIILQTIMSALLPNLAKEFVTNKERFTVKMNIMFKFLIICGSLLCFFISMFRSELVYLIFGEEYKNTGDVLLTQCWYAVFHAIFALFGNSLAAMRQDKWLMGLSVMYAIVSLAIFWPASYYGAVVLSYGVILMCIVNMSYHYIIIKKLQKSFISYKHAMLLFGLVIVTMVISFVIGTSFGFIYRVLTCLSVLLSIMFFYKPLLNYIRLN